MNEILPESPAVNVIHKTNTAPYITVEVSGREIDFYDDRMVGMTKSRFEDVDFVPIPQSVIDSRIQGLNKSIDYTADTHKNANRVLRCCMASPLLAGIAFAAAYQEQIGYTVGGLTALGSAATISYGERVIKRYGRDHAAVEQEKRQQVAALLIVRRLAITTED